MYNLTSDCPSLFQNKKMHDLVNNCLFGVDFKMERNIFVFYYTTLPKKMLCKFIKNYLICMVKKSFFKLWQCQIVY